MASTDTLFAHLLDFCPAPLWRDKPSWTVRPVGNPFSNMLGMVLWEPLWRRYVFAPYVHHVTSEATLPVFAPEHLREIIAFCESHTRIENNCVPGTDPVP